MDDQSNDQSENQNNERPEVVAPEDRWPQQPPRFKDVYGFQDPQWHVPMVAMTLQTWQELDRLMGKTRKQLEKLSEENIKMKQGIHVDGPRIVLPS